MCIRDRKGILHFDLILVINDPINIPRPLKKKLKIPNLYGPIFLTKIDEKEKSFSNKYETGITAPITIEIPAPNGLASLK